MKHIKDTVEVNVGSTEEPKKVSGPVEYSLAENPGEILSLLEKDGENTVKAYNYGVAFFARQAVRNKITTDNPDPEKQIESVAKKMVSAFEKMGLTLSLAEAIKNIKDKQASLTAAQ